VVAPGTSLARRNPRNCIVTHQPQQVRTCRWQMTVVPAGMGCPSSSSSADRWRTTTGTTEYLRSDSCRQVLKEVQALGVGVSLCCCRERHRPLCSQLVQVPGI
jgi:hypothetical protein